MEKQRWSCETCKKSGEVTLRRHEDVWSVATKLREAHRKASPTCTTDPRVSVNLKRERSKNDASRSGRAVGKRAW
jgi:hypothetical protein